MEDVLGDALPIEIVVCALGEVDADIDVLWVEDVLYTELDLQLKENVLLEVEGDLVLYHYLDVEGKLHPEICVLCGSDGDRFRVDHSYVSLTIAP